MENANRRKAQCASKKPFATEEEASAFGAPLQQYSYRCEICGVWHLTTGLRGSVSKAAKLGRSAMRHGLIKPSRLRRRR